jgi:hypothetical protein
MGTVQTFAEEDGRTLDVMKVMSPPSFFLLITGFVTTRLVVVI